MANYCPYEQAQEEAHFDSRCIVCHYLAQSPLHVEMQHLSGDESVYIDIDGTRWVKCDNCNTPFHLKCATEESEPVLEPNVFFVLSPAAGYLNVSYVTVLSVETY